MHLFRSFFYKKQIHNPIISLIMPVYNSEPYIKKAISSIIDQSYKNIELIIIDNGSTDNSAKIVLNFAKKHNFIKLYHCMQRGVSYARNKGLEVASGDYIGFLDSDDYYENKDYIKKRVSYIEKYNKDVTTCNVKFVNENGKQINFMSAKKLKFKDFFDCKVHTNSVIFKSEIIKSIGFDTTLSNGEDWLTWAKIARMGYTYYPVPNCDCLYVYRHNTVREDFYKHTISLIKVLEEIYSNDNNQIYAKKYRNGLQKPPLAQIKTQRIFALILFYIFDKNQNILKLIFNQYALDIKNIFQLKKKIIKSTFINTAKRYYMQDDYNNYIDLDHLWLTLDRVLTNTQKKIIKGIL